MQQDPRAHSEHTENDEDKKGGRPGHVDKGRDGGMAPREIAPDVIEPTEEPPD